MQLLNDYTVLDAETTTHNKGHPFDPRNKLISYAYTWDTALYFKYYTDPDFRQFPKGRNTYVGFNIKFDIHWLFPDGVPPEVEVWDCQLAEYFLRAQHPDAQMCSLTDTAPKYGGTGKIDEVKALWDAGVKTSEIPEDLLIDYLVGTPEEQRNGGDIRNTDMSNTCNTSMSAPAHHWPERVRRAMGRQRRGMRTTSRRV